MKILYFFLIILFSSNVFSETYICKYKKLNQDKKISLDRITHSHFKICNDDNCEDQKLSVIFADNYNIIIGDVINKNKNDEYFLLFIINKKTKFFSKTNIYFPNSKKNNIFFKGQCLID